MARKQEPRTPRPAGTVGDEVSTERPPVSQKPGAPARKDSPETDGGASSAQRSHDASVGTEAENESDQSLEH